MTQLTTAAPASTIAAAAAAAAGRGVGRRHAPLHLRARQRELHHVVLPLLVDLALARAVRGGSVLEVRHVLLVQPRRRLEGVVGLLPRRVLCLALLEQLLEERPRVRARLRLEAPLLGLGALLDLLRRLRAEEPVVVGLEHRAGHEPRGSDPLGTGLGDLRSRLGELALR